MVPETWFRLYCGPAPLPADIGWRWNLDPLLLIALAAMALLLRHSRAGLAGVAVMAVAFVSPLCALSAALFSARVVHHVLLVAVAAPLLALARPARTAASPTLPLLVAALVLWVWHWPAAYDLALSFVPAYWLMQATLLGSAVLFWRATLHPAQGTGPALLAILGGWMQMALLGALLTFAPEPLYAAHAAAPLAWGLSPLTDQQLGGLLMWVPAGLPYLLLAAWAARRDWADLRGHAA